MKKFYFSMLLILIATSVGIAQAGSNSVAGRITNTVARPDGFLIEVDSGIPSLCSGTIGYWMIIPESNKSMLAMALMNSENKKFVEVYTQGEFLNGICKVSMLYMGE